MGDRYSAEVRIDGVLAAVARAVVDLRGGWSKGWVLKGGYELGWVRGYLHRLERERTSEFMENLCFRGRARTRP